MNKSILIAIAILLGIFFPQFYVFTFLIRYSLIVMLLLTFTGISIKFKDIKPSHLLSVILVIVASLFHYWWIGLWFPKYAMLGFVLGSAPTAAAAAVVSNMMKLNTPYVTIATIVSNVVMVIFIPLVLPFLIQQKLSVSPILIVLQIFITLGIPFILGQLITHYSPSLTKQINSAKPFSFVLFIANMFIASANASQYIRTHDTINSKDIFIIACLTLVIGLLNFKMGEWTAPKAFKYECGLATGRKNTMFALWISLTYINPITALSPVCYLIFHNIYNAVQLWILDRKRKSLPK
ncbi:hypothetical protein ACG2LH_01605 [Zhouia sp. PK063]|uniref:hypothetical protein n=1 Tax=Zhouia sp. PK063 TaxID=3373602 RepID=UPI0037BDEA56